MSDSDWTILECPECQSKRAGILREDPPKAKCADCGHVYDIATLPPHNLNEALKAAKKKRTATPGVRHRVDNGPEELEVEPEPELTREQVGSATNDLQLIIAGGEQGLIAAHRQANKLSQKFGEEFEAKWLLMTDWLRQLSQTHRARARYALRWRPRFLAAMALTRSPIMGARAAQVSPQTVSLHRARDPQFELQCLQAEEHATQMLKDRAFSLALEGTCEPVFWQGIRVGHVRKHDGRLLVEVLRAHAPTVYKAPGQHNVKLSVNAPGATFNLVDEATRDELVALRQEALQQMDAKRKALTAPVIDV